ncbi:MAG: DUF3305 domain-containing protein [Gammaproteobacteria bacterium]|nr:DUF3305 domain-containing protein [Gammaproteobacteria bacterium]
MSEPDESERDARPARDCDPGSVRETADAMPVTVVLEYRSGVHPVPGTGAWRVAEVALEGAPAAGERRRRVLLGPQAQTRHVWDGLWLRIDPDACEECYHNLRSPSPGVFVLCRLGPDGVLEPRRVAASFLEAAAGAGADDLVCRVPMSTGIRRWLEQSPLARYLPELRRRVGPEAGE